MSAKWDAYYLNLCTVVAQLSKDQSTQLGCVIAGPAHEIRSTGYNSFPRGINDDVPDRQYRPVKYLFMEHAERNAIYNAARVGIPLEGCTLYCQWLPCADCARAIIQAGIVAVVVANMKIEERWEASIGAGLQMLRESNVVVRSVDV